VRISRRDSSLNPGLLLHVSPGLFEACGKMRDAYSTKDGQFLRATGLRMLDGGRRRGKFRAARG